MPFKKNTFAITCIRVSTHEWFMNSLVPAQLKAITHLIVQPSFMGAFTRNQLMRFKGLIALQFEFVAEHLFIYTRQHCANRGS